MKFFFDNCIPIRAARALFALGVEGEHLHDRFTNEPDIADATWIPQVQKAGFVAISGDGSILKKPAEREVLTTCGLRMVFFMSMSHLPLWPQAVLMVRAWPEIEKWSQKSKGGQLARVTAQAKFEPLRL